MKTPRWMVAAVAAATGLSGIIWTMQQEGRAQLPPGPKVKVKVVTKAPSGPAPVVEAGDLMRLFNKPLYTHLKEAMEREPNSKEGWDTIHERGLQAAEVANLVAMRRAKPPQDQWLEGALNLQQAGLTLAKAAEARDWGATERAYVALINQCNGCHEARAPGKAPMLKP
jgi:hypothetical protein